MELTQPLLIMVLPVQIVKSNGTHATVINNGPVKTIVNPDGTHSTVIHNGGLQTIINPNGTCNLMSTGNKKAIIHRNGTHSLLTKKGAVMTGQTAKGLALFGFSSFYGIKFSNAEKNN